MNLMPVALCGYDKSWLSRDVIAFAGDDSHVDVYPRLQDGRAAFCADKGGTG
jgi:hypothetical protein